MQATALYHREVYMPAKVAKLGRTRIGLRPTQHARHAAQGDRYGALTIPAAIEFVGADVVEAEFVGGRLSKLVIRLSYDAQRDAIYVVIPDGTLKTVWLNLKSDAHSTLNRSRYARAM